MILQKCISRMMQDVFLRYIAIRIFFLFLGLTFSWEGAKYLPGHRIYLCFAGLSGFQVAGWGYDLKIQVCSYIFPNPPLALFVSRSANTSLEYSFLTLSSNLEHPPPDGGNNGDSVINQSDIQNEINSM